MLKGDGSELHDALTGLFNRAKVSPSEEQTILKGLESLKKALSNPLLISSFCSLKSPSIPPDPNSLPKVNKIVLDHNDEVEAANFAKELSRGLNVQIRHRDIVEFSKIVGPKYGIYPTRDEKRNKQGIFLWVKRHFNVIQSDLEEFLSSKHQN